MEFFKKRHKSESSSANASAWSNFDDPQNSQIPPAHEAIKDESLRALNGYESREILNTSVIDGDPWYQDGQDYQLTPETLEHQGLFPAFKVGIGDREIGLSKVFKVGSRDSVIAYVKDGEETKVRSYYRSNSQGVWRYLPDYVVGDDNGVIEWYGKGYNEEALTLPAKMQESLSVLADAPQCRAGELTTNPNFILAGTAKRYFVYGQYGSAKSRGDLRGDFYNEVSATTPSIEMGWLGHEKVPPESLDLSSNYSPIFDRPTAKWYATTTLYGPVEMTCFPSADGDLAYTFCRDSSGRAWIAGVEKPNSKISSTGCRTEWVSAGDYATPLYEYDSQSGSYGGQPLGNTKYVSMWEKYLSKMPIIQKYLTSIQNY